MNYYGYKESNLATLWQIIIFDTTTNYFGMV